MGQRALSDAELLALIIGTGAGGANAVDTARKLLIECQGLDGMASKGLGAINTLPGVGEAKGARIIAALELGLRVVESQKQKGRGLRMDCSADVFDRYQARLGGMKQEVFMALGLSSKNETLRARLTQRTCHFFPRYFLRFGAGFWSCLATFSNSLSMARGWVSRKA